MNPTPNHNDFDKFLHSSINSDVPPDVEARLRLRLDAFRARMEAAASAPAPRLSLLAAITHSWRRMLAFAVPVTAAATILLVVFLTAGGGHAARAYAQAIEQLHKARTFTYKMLLPQTGVIPMSLQVEVACKEPGLIRQTMAPGVVSVIDFAQRKGITVIPATRQYIEMDFSKIDFSTMLDGNNQVNVIEEMRKIPSRANEILGRRQLDGRTVQDFRVTTGGVNMIVSVDVRTGNLVRMEGGFLNAQGMNVVLSDFQFDVELDDSLFDLTPPAGYTRAGMTVNVTEASEEDLVHFLRWWAEHNEDRLLPPSLHPMKIAENLQALVLSGKFTGMEAGRSLDDEFRDTFRMVQGMMFVMRMMPENDWHYAGEGVKLGAADKAVFRYKPTGKTAYRVIYGDLSVRDQAM